MILVTSRRPVPFFFRGDFIGICNFLIQPSLPQHKEKRWLLYMSRSSSPFLPTSYVSSVPDSSALVRLFFAVPLTAFAFAFSTFVPLRPLPLAALPFCLPPAALPPLLPLAGLPTCLPIAASSPFLPLGALSPLLPPGAGLPSLLSVAGVLPSFQSISP